MDPQTLEESIARHPDLLDPYLVYADWLQTQGGDAAARGELIMLHYARMRTRDPRELAELQHAEEKLLRRFEEPLLGLFSKMATQVEWFMGFIHRAAIHTDDFEEIHPFLTHPAARFLRTLRVDGPAPKNTSWPEHVAMLIETGHPFLQHLRVADWGTLWQNPGTQIGDGEAVFLGDFTQVPDAFPNLRSLHLGGRAVLPERAPLTELTMTARMTDETCHAVMHGFTDLLTLRVWASAEQVTGRGLDPLWDTTACPRLQELAICAQPADELIGRILEAPLLDQLEILDLRHVPFTDLHLVRLLENKRRFSHLDDLRIERHHLSVSGRKDADRLVLGLRPGESSLLGLARRGKTGPVLAYLNECDAHPQELSEALFPAADAGHAPVITILLDRGADPNARDRGWKATPVGRAAMSGHADCVQYLIDKGADPNAVDRFGYTPLMRAAFSGHADCCWILLEAGANPRPQNADGLDALMLAAGEGHADVVRLWLDRDLDTTHAIAGRTALDEAKLFNRRRVIELLSQDDAA